MLPTVTFPKLTLAGLTVSWACVCVAVPLSTIESVEFEALLVIAIEPLGLPAEVGANTALKDALWPGLITWPADKPLML